MLDAAVVATVTGDAVVRADDAAALEAALVDRLTGEDSFRRALVNGFGLGVLVKFRFGLCPLCEGCP